MTWAAFRGELAGHTDAHRVRCAKEHLRKAFHAERERAVRKHQKTLVTSCRRRRQESTIVREAKALPAKRNEPCGECKECLSNRATWHRRRARGHLERFDRAHACGSEQTGHVVCEACRCEHAVSARCECWRVCVGCRSHAAFERRARMGLARARVVSECAKRGGLRKRQRGGPFWERMVTLTIPHVGPDAFASVPERFRHLEGDELAIVMRVETLFRAWRFFSRSWNKYWREHRSYAGRAWLYRAFEWTPGDDLLGHPHFHVWTFAQFFNENMVRGWWADALRRAGLLLTNDAWVIVDVKPLRSNLAQFSRELFKGGKREGLQLSKLEPVDGGVLTYADGWSLAEVAEDGRRLSAAMVARLYEALEGRHVAHASRGLLPDHVLAACPECETVGTLRMVVDRKERDLALAKSFGVGTGPAFANSA